MHRVDASSTDIFVSTPEGILAVPLPVDRLGWTPDPLNAECPSRQVLDLVADKWAVLVIAAIAEGHHRNGQLLRRIGGISQKALTRSLRDLAYNGLVYRHDFAEVPPRVEYTLTPTGQSLQPLLAALSAGRSITSTMSQAPRQPQRALRPSRGVPACPWSSVLRDQPIGVEPKWPQQS